MRRIVLAYAGGLDASVAIPWLKEKYAAEVITATLDLGQGRELEEIRDRALAAGASRAHVLDAREEFGVEYVLRALKAGAIGENGDPMAALLARPLIARKLIQLADIEQAAFVAHVEGEPPARRALDRSVQALRPGMRVLEPAYEWTMMQDDKLAYAHARGLATPDAGEDCDRVNLNLWGRTVKIGALAATPTEEVYVLTKRAADCPDEAAQVEIAFDRGEPAAINGVTMPLLELVASLGTIAGAHGVGRLVIRNGRAADPSCHVCEAPAAIVLHAAHAELQARLSDQDLNRFSRTVSARYADVVEQGLWFTPLREALDAYVDKVQERLSGIVLIKLFKGACQIVGCRSPQPDQPDAVAPTLVTEHQ